MPKCKYCGEVMYCIETFRDGNLGTVVGFFSCDCEKSKKHKEAEISKMRHYGFR